MAKGNDGNLLQHATELAAASQLLEAVDVTGMTFVFTHAMRPFESLDCEPGDTGTMRLTEMIRRATLMRAGKVHPDAQPPIVHAFHDLNVCSQRYPNSAEFLRWTAQRARKHLGGLLIEVESAKWPDIERAWDGSGVRLLRGSWRDHLPSFTTPHVPWLVSMDPMTFVEADKGGACLSPLDLDRLAAALGPWFAGSSPAGILVICCYSLRPRAQRIFQRHLRRFKEDLGLAVSMDILAVQQHGPNRHIGALFSRDPLMLNAVRSAVSEVLRLEPIYADG